MKTKIIISLLAILSYYNAKSQITYEKVLWDKECDCPVAYASINNPFDYVTSNESGNFSITTKDPNVEINMLGYYSKKINLNDIKEENKIHFEINILLVNYR